MKQPERGFSFIAGSKALQAAAQGAHLVDKPFPLVQLPGAGILAENLELHIFGSHLSVSYTHLDVYKRQV